MTYREKTRADPHADGQADQQPADNTKLKEKIKDFDSSTPIPLADRVTVPPFPVNSLPKPIADMVRAVSVSTQTDLAMAGTSALTMLSACTGGHAEVVVRNGWREPLNIYTATVAVPGERKSPVQEKLAWPIKDVERRLTEENAAARRDAEQRKQVATKAVERQRNVAAKAHADQMQTELDAVIGLAEEADRIVVPPVPRLIADDTTSEAAASLLAEQGGAVAVISTEGGIFDIIAGQYSPKGTSNMSLWLKAHSGDSLRVDRKGRPPEHIPRPALTMGLMLQPDVLSTIAARHEFRGRGLLARFLYSHPISKVGHRQVPAPPMDEEVEKRYQATVMDLARGMRTPQGRLVLLDLDKAASAELESIEVAVEPTLAGDGELAVLADWGGKYVGAVARITGNLHLAEHGATEGSQKPIGVKTVRAARKLGEYFRCSAINAFSEMGLNQSIADAVYLLGRIRHLGKDVVSERDMHVASRTRFPLKVDMKFALDVLVDHGWLLALDKPQSTGGRPGSRPYRVHPSTKVTKDTEGSS